MQGDCAEKTSSASTFLRFHVSIVGIVSVAATFSCVGTGLAFLGGIWWFFELFSHWRVQYFLSLAVVSLLMFTLRHRKEAVCYAAFAFINGSTLLPLYIDSRTPVSSTNSHLRVAMSNVNMYHGDPPRTVSVLRELDAEIVVLLEIGDRWMDALAPLRESHPHYHEIPREDNFGIGLYSVFPFVTVETRYLGGNVDDQASSRHRFIEFSVPSIIAVLAVPNQQVTLIATHPVPPLSARHAAARNVHLEALARLSREVDPPIILMGDLNATRWSPHFKRLVRASGLVDSARSWGIQGTWPAGLSILRIPIDHCLYSPTLTVTSRVVGPATGSDHYPLTLEFGLPPGSASE